MFIDSDFNGNSFGSFDNEDTLYNSNYANASGDSFSVFNLAKKYDIKPSKEDFDDGGISNCSSIFSSYTCNWELKIPQYGISSTVTDVFDTIAISKNSYGYNLSEMKENLSRVQEEVNSLVPFTSNMTCEQYVSVLSSLNETLSSWNGASVTHLYDRDLREEYLSAIAEALGEVSSYMDARDCDGVTSAIDTAQESASSSDAAQKVAEANAKKSEAEAKKSEAEAKKLVARTKAKAKSDADNMRAKNEEEKDALNKRNKIIMFGAGLVVLVLLVLKKK
jgi:hypothetical protein